MPIPRFFYKNCGSSPRSRGGRCNRDEQGINELLKVDGQTLAVNFRTAAEKFKLIQDNDCAPVIVRYCGLDGSDETVEKLLNTLKNDGQNAG